MSVVVSWEEGNIHEWSVVTYPDKLLVWAETEFCIMKERQAKLLGIRPRSKRNCDGATLALPAIASKL